jgi:hypothetical protein
LKGRIHFTELSTSNDKRDTHTDTQTDGGFMKYAVEMRSDAMIYIPSFIKIDSAIQKLM